MNEMNEIINNYMHPTQYVGLKIYSNLANEIAIKCNCYHNKVKENGGKNSSPTIIYSLKEFMNEVFYEKINVSAIYFDVRSMCLVIEFDNTHKVGIMINNITKYVLSKQK